MKFTDLEQLKAHLIEDAKVPDTCPVRFIHITSLEMWIKVKAHLLTLVNKHLFLSEFCEDTDTAPNLNHLKPKIRAAETPTLVASLSEYLRINYPVAEKTINDILKANYENNSSGKLRIYIPLYRMNDILSKITLDPRQKKSILYLDTIADTDYSLTIVQGDLDISLGGNQVKGYREYLMYWEQNPDKPVVFYTNKAVIYQNVLFADNVTVIVCSYDLLRYHHKMPPSVEKNWGTEEQWRELARGYQVRSDFETTVCNLLAAPHYSDSLFKNWSLYDLHKRWLLWILAKYKCPQSYIGLAAKTSTSVENFQDVVYQEIGEHLDASDFFQLAKTRRQLILDMKLTPSQVYLDRIAMLEPAKQLCYLTDLSQKEKEMILLAYAKNPTTTNREMFARVYPDAYDYLSGKCNFDSDRLENYFSTYRSIKICNQATEDFLDEVNELACQNLELVWQLEARNAKVNSLYSNHSVIYFVDALGVEYLPFLLSALEKHGEYDVDTFITHCNLPTVTEFNTDFLDGKNQEVYYELDKLKHSQIKYPGNILSELGLLKNVVEKIKELLQNYSSVILTGDHGSSRAAVLYRSYAPVHKAKEESQLKKYGRYCIDTINDYSNLDGCFQYNENWVFANYSRFSENGAPACEIHGGAALEELIVPILYIKKKEIIGVDAPVIQVFGYPDKIKVNPSKPAIVSFRLSAEHTSVIAVMRRQRIPCDFTNGEYKFETPIGISGKQTIKLISAGKVLGEIVIDFVKGIASKSEFDI